MKTPMRNINLLMFILLFTTTDVSTLYSADEDALRAIGTYECIGLYLKSPDLGQCRVRCRQKGTSTWRDGYPLVHDRRDNEYRGSIVGLKPGTVYDIKIILNNKSSELRCTTKNDHFHIGKITYLEAGIHTKPLRITESGTPKGYHLIMPAKESKATIDVRNAEDYTCVIDADYVIVRGVEFRNAAIHGLLIKSGRHDNVIEDCRFTF
jgi:hypothetical protein